MESISQDEKAIITLRNNISRLMMDDKSKEEEILAGAVKLSSIYLMNQKTPENLDFWMSLE
jgi:hypothetical protein